jgi:GntR family transcriptional regulator
MTLEEQTSFIEMNGNTDIPLYRRVEDTVLEEIATGNFKEGDLIPSEIELSKRYGVSQGTVRNAILNLTQRGILYRKQGKGTFVVFQRSSIKRHRNFRFVPGLKNELVAINMIFLGITVIRATGELTDALGVKKNTKLIKLERMGEITPNQLIHSISYMPQNMYPGLEKYTAEDFLKNTLWKLQQIYFKINLVKREEFISVVEADGELARILETDEGSPLLQVEIKAITAENEIAEYRVFRVKPGPFRFFNTLGPV